MMTPQQALADISNKLGYKPLNRRWAKLEILLGLFSTGVGFLLGVWTLARDVSDLTWSLAAAALGLFVLGGYLALAGHRSHLYQSNNELIAYLAAEIHELKSKGIPE